MSNLNDIKNHISGVSTTRQITNAMYLLSTSRLKKDMLVTPALTEYMCEIRNAMENILYYADMHSIRHKFTEKDDKGIALYLVVMGDKGLCGDYNSAVAALVSEIRKKDPTCEVITYGLYGNEYLTRKNLYPEYDLAGSTMHFAEKDIRRISDRLIEMYMTDYFNELYVVSTPYSRGARKPQCLKLLPLKTEDFIDVDRTDDPGDMIFAPSINKLFADIVPEYLMGVLYDLILQASASENASRMEAMKSATENADEMITSLSAKLNAERQLGITNEITEITASQL